MRISEILYSNTEPAEINLPDSQLDRTPVPIHDPLAKLATAFTRRGLVKHLWSLNSSEDEPCGPPPPDPPGTESVPRDTSYPATSSEEPSPSEPSLPWVSTGSPFSSRRRGLLGD